MLEDRSNRLLTVVPVLISKRKAILICRRPTGLSACRPLRTVGLRHIGRNEDDCCNISGSGLNTRPGSRG
ncbi:hypothetical protein J6590_095582 [Homalodisca vitripennis]|nr:hypothetical protein J6590_095582 [Homalodisca vitripennis]